MASRLGLDAVVEAFRIPLPALPQLIHGEHPNLREIVTPGLGELLRAYWFPPALCSIIFR